LKKIFYIIHKNIKIIILILLFLFLRLYHFEDSLNFGSDQGLELLKIHEIYTTGKLTLIGPPSSFVQEGRFFFAGPVVYYMLIPPLAIAKFHPFAVSYTLILFQLISLLTVYKVLQKKWPKTLMPLLFVLIYIFTPLIVEYSRFQWHPNFIIPLSGIIFALILKLSYTNKLNNLILLLIGILLGLGMQIHYSFILSLFASVISLVLILKSPKLNFILVFLGFIIGFFPLLLFEIRHNFYNLSTIWQYFTSSKGTLSGKRPMDYYFFGLVPFAVYIISYALEKVRKINKNLLLILFALYLLWSLNKILPVPDRGFSLPQYWNFQALKKVENIILSQNRKNYNIVDVLTGDTRAMALRYLLTIEGSLPLDVTEYPYAQYLFVYSKVPINKILKGYLWEIDSIKPVKVTKTWNINKDINLYLLEKDKPLKKIIK